MFPAGGTCVVPILRSVSFKYLLQVINSVYILRDSGLPHSHLQEGQYDYENLDRG
jgi:hypothetical protein